MKRLQRAPTLLALALLAHTLGAHRGLSVVSPPACGRNRMTCETNPSKRIAVNSGCPVQVSIDGALLYRGRGGDIDWASTFDINEMAVKNLSGIEYYRNESEVPASLAPPGAACGMIAFWTRRN